jgi:hypothetical protein
MGCCALGTCVDPDCYLCAVVAKLPQPESAAEREERKAANATRDGAPTLAGERKRKNIAFRKRHREGPHRGNA